VLDVTEQLHRYADAVTEGVEPVSAADVPLTMTQPRRVRRPVWQPLAAAATVLALLGGGVWFATRSSDPSPSDQGVATGGDDIEVGVASVLIPDGMKLVRLGYFDPVNGDRSTTKTSDGTVIPAPTVRSIRARLSTAAGMCTITNYRGTPGLRRFNSLEVERFNAELMHLAQLRTTLEGQISVLNQQLASMPPRADSVVEAARQRDLAVKQLDTVNQQAVALGQTGPQRVSVGEGFTPTDAGRTTWRAQATRTDAFQIICPNAATARQLVDATSLPTPAP
jgi:hypothetical protein